MNFSRLISGWFTRVDKKALLAVLRDARALIARPDNDFSWSGWEDTAAALAEMNPLIAAAEAGKCPIDRSRVLFLPTGPIQEVSISSGWAQEFLTLAARFDRAIGETTDTH